MDIFCIIILHKLDMSLSCIYTDLVCKLLFCVTKASEECLKQKKWKNGVMKHFRRTFASHMATHYSRISTWACVPLLESFLRIFNWHNDIRIVTQSCTQSCTFFRTVFQVSEDRKQHHQPYDRVLDCVGLLGQPHSLAHGLVAYDSFL